jgi:hypothetical protein
MRAECAHFRTTDDTDTTDDRRGGCDVLIRVIRVIRGFLRRSTRASVEAVVVRAFWSFDLEIVSDFVLRISGFDAFGDLPLVQCAP